MAYSPTNTYLTYLFLTLYFLLWFKDKTAISGLDFPFSGVTIRFIIASPSDYELV